MTQTEVPKFNIFEITNRTTGEKAWQAASTAQDACVLAGWLIGDCYVIESPSRYTPVKNQEPICLVKIPCKVCTYQWAECTAPAQTECPCRSSSPDLQSWLTEVTKAHLCDYVGIVLSRTDHHLGQKWLPMEKAIEELEGHH